MSPTFETTLETLSQVTELSTKVIAKIAGEEISTHIGGEQFHRDRIRHAVAASLQKHLAKNKGGVA